MKTTYKTFYLASLLGVIPAAGLWLTAILVKEGIMEPTGVLTGYPAGIHAEQMFALFMLPMAAGFIFEQWGSWIFRKNSARLIYLIGIISLLPLSYLEERTPFYGLGLVLTLPLLYSILDRGFHNLSEKLALRLAQTALLCAAAGLFFLFSFSFSKTPGLFNAGHSLLYYGFFPALYAAFVARFRSRYMAESAPKLPSHRMIFILLAIYLFSFILEFYIFVISKSRFPLQYGAWIRLVVLLVLIAGMLPLFRPAMYKKSPEFHLMLAAWSFILGLGGHALVEETRAHYAHFFFAGSLTYLAIIWVKELPEFDKKRLSTLARWGVPLILFLAAFTRGTVHMLVSKVFYSHLLYASISLIIAAVWQFVRIVRSKDS